jgi:hypothetical protein
MNSAAVIMFHRKKAHIDRDADRKGYPENEACGVGRYEQPPQRVSFLKRMRCLRKGSGGAVRAAGDRLVYYYQLP